MPPRACLFDLGGTLFGYAPFRPHLERLLAETARRYAIDAPAEALRRAYERADDEGERFYTAQRELGSALAKAGEPPPAEVLFVGDTPGQDAAGANALGLESVLLARGPGADRGLHRPRHVISDLCELLALVPA